MCDANRELIRLHPLYLVSFIYELRFQSWSKWLSLLWRHVNDIETVTNMTSETWKRRDMSPERLDALKDTDTLLTFLHGTHTELCHGETVVTFANKLGRFCLEALDAVEQARERQGLSALSGRTRSGLEERMKFTAARCDAVSDRLLEMKERLRGQIQVVSGNTCP